MEFDVDKMQTVTSEIDQSAFLALETLLESFDSNPTVEAHKGMIDVDNLRRLLHTVRRNWQERIFGYHHLESSCSDNTELDSENSSISPGQSSHAISNPYIPACPERERERERAAATPFSRISVESLLNWKDDYY